MASETEFSHCAICRLFKRHPDLPQVVLLRELFSVDVSLVRRTSVASFYARKYLSLAVSTDDCILHVMGTCGKGVVVKYEWTITPFDESVLRRAAPPTGYEYPDPPTVVAAHYTPYAIARVDAGGLGSCASVRKIPEPRAAANTQKEAEEWLKKNTIPIESDADLKAVIADLKAEIASVYPQSRRTTCEYSKKVSGPDDEPYRWEHLCVTCGRTSVRCSCFFQVNAHLFFRG